MVFFLSSLVTYELFVVSRFQIKRDWTTQRDALPFGWEKERPLVAIPFLHPLFSHLDALKGIRPRSARMEDYIVIIKD